MEDNIDYAKVGETLLVKIRKMVEDLNSANVELFLKDLKIKELESKLAKK